MTRPTAFSATYSDFKLVKTRKVAQLVFEVPLEAVDAALTVVGGMPDPGAERWFGIAPLRNEPEAKPPKDKKHWRDMPPAQQAGIRCNDATFWAFLKEEKGFYVTDEPSATVVVHTLCNITSRSELSTNHVARMIWNKLDSEYAAWKTLEHA